MIYPLVNLVKFHLQQLMIEVMEKNRWYTTFTISNAIGQGEVLATPIQLANMAAAIGNRGFYYTPHIIKKIENGQVTFIIWYSIISRIGHYT